MERMQSLYWHLVEYDLSESGVTPMTIRDLLGPKADAEAFLQTALGYPLSEGSHEARANIAAWYPGAAPENVSLVERRLGGQPPDALDVARARRPPGVHDARTTCRAGAWPALRQGDRHVQAEAPGRALAARPGPAGARGHQGTKAVMVCNPNNPTGHVLTEDEMDAVIAAADRVGAWIVADEIYRGAEVDIGRRVAHVLGPLRQGHRHERAVEGVRDAGVARRDGRSDRRMLIEQTWIRHDYTTLAPGMISDRLAAFAMDPVVRENIFARTRAIIRANLPQFESWIHAQGDVFTYVRPVAGAIGYVKYHLPVRSTELVDRVRAERSVLLVPGDMFGLGKGIRFGFGFDIEHTMKGLARAEDLLTGRVA